jgi:hypothetical protein
MRLDCSECVGENFIQVSEPALFAFEGKTWPRHGSQICFGRAEIFGGERYLVKQMRCDAPEESKKNSRTGVSAASGRRRGGEDDVQEMYEGRGDLEKNETSFISAACY